MAELIPIEEITELKSASEVKEVATAAPAIHEQQSVAALINNAANAGQHSCFWNHTLSDELITTLRSKGYRVTHSRHSAYDSVGYRIEGF